MWKVSWRKDARRILKDGPDVWIDKFLGEWRELLIKCRIPEESYPSDASRPVAVKIFEAFLWRLIRDFKNQAVCNGDSVDESEDSFVNLAAHADECEFLDPGVSFIWSEKGNALYITHCPEDANAHDAVPQPTFSSGITMDQVVAAIKLRTLTRQRRPFRVSLTEHFFDELETLLEKFDSGSNFSIFRHCTKVIIAIMKHIEVQEQDLRDVCEFVTPLQQQETFLRKRRDEESEKKRKHEQDVTKLEKALEKNGKTKGTSTSVRGFAGETSKPHDNPEEESIFQFGFVPFNISYRKTLDSFFRNIYDPNLDISHRSQLLKELWTDVGSVGDYSALSLACMELSFLYSRGEARVRGTHASLKLQCDHVQILANGTCLAPRFHMGTSLYDEVDGSAAHILAQKDFVNTVIIGELRGQHVLDTTGLCTKAQKKGAMQKSRAVGKNLREPVAGGENSAETENTTTGTTHGDQKQTHGEKKLSPMLEARLVFELIDYILFVQTDIRARLLHLAFCRKKESNTDGTRDAVFSMKDRDATRIMETHAGAESLQKKRDFHFDCESESMVILFLREKQAQSIGAAEHNIYVTAAEPGIVKEYESILVDLFCDVIFNPGWLCNLAVRDPVVREAVSDFCIGNLDPAKILETDKNRDEYVGIYELGRLICDNLKRFERVARRGKGLVSPGDDDEGAVGSAAPGAEKTVLLQDFVEPLKRQTVVDLLQHVYGVKSFRSATEIKRTVAESLVDASGMSIAERKDLHLEVSLESLIKFEHILDEKRLSEDFSHLLCSADWDNLLYHGAPSRAVIESISKRGFVCEGEELSGTPFSRGVTHGSALGAGIYVSPNPRTAAGYTFADTDQYAVLVVALSNPYPARRPTCTYAHRTHDGWRKANEAIDHHPMACFAHGQKDLAPMLLVYFKLPISLRVGYEPQNDSNLLANASLLQEAKQYIVKSALVDSAESGSIANDDVDGVAIQRQLLDAQEDGLLTKEEYQKKYQNQQAPGKSGNNIAGVVQATTKYQIANDAGWIDPAAQRKAEKSLKNQLDAAFQIEFWPISSGLSVDSKVEKDSQAQLKSLDVFLGGKNRNSSGTLYMNRTIGAHNDRMGGHKSGMFYRLRIPNLVKTVITEGATKAAFYARRMAGLGLYRNVSWDPLAQALEMEGNTSSRVNPIQREVRRKMILQGTGKERNSKSKTKTLYSVILIDLETPISEKAMLHMVSTLVGQISEMAEVCLIIFSKDSVVATVEFAGFSEAINRLTNILSGNPSSKPKKEDANPKFTDRKTYETGDSEERRDTFEKVLNSLEKSVIGKHASLRKKHEEMCLDVMAEWESNPKVAWVSESSIPDGKDSSRSKLTLQDEARQATANYAATLEFAVVLLSPMHFVTRENVFVRARHTERVLAEKLQSFSGCFACGPGDNINVAFYPVLLQSKQAVENDANFVAQAELELQRKQKEEKNMSRDTFHKRKGTHVMRGEVSKRNIVRETSPMEMKIAFCIYLSRNLSTSQRLLMGGGESGLGYDLIDLSDGLELNENTVSSKIAALVERLNLSDSLLYQSMSIPRGNVSHGSGFVVDFVRTPAWYANMSTSLFYSEKGHVGLPKQIIIDGFPCGVKVMMGSRGEEKLKREQELMGGTADSSMLDFYEHLVVLSSGLKLAVVANKDDGEQRFWNPLKSLRNVDFYRKLLRKWISDVSEKSESSAPRRESSNRSSAGDTEGVILPGSPDSAEAIEKAEASEHTDFDLLDLETLESYELLSDGGLSVITEDSFVVVGGNNHISKEGSTLKDIAEEMPVVTGSVPENSTDKTATSADTFHTTAQMVSEQRATLQRMRFVERRKAILYAMQQVLNDVEDVVLLRTTPVAEWCRKLKDMKYGTRALKLVNRANEKACVNKKSTVNEKTSETKKPLAALVSGSPKNASLLERAKLSSSGLVTSIGRTNSAKNRMLSEMAAAGDDPEKSFETDIAAWLQRHSRLVLEKFMAFPDRKRIWESFGSGRDEVRKKLCAELDSAKDIGFLDNFVSIASEKSDLEHFHAVHVCEKMSKALSAKKTGFDLAEWWNCAVGMPGLMVDVRRIESAVVDPWQIIINNVSTEIADTSSAFCKATCKSRLNDGIGQSFSDVICLLHCDLRKSGGESQQQRERYITMINIARKFFLDSPIYHSYMAVVFTRNTALTVPGQRFALTASVWLKLAEVILLKTKANDANWFQRTWQHYQDAGATVLHFVRRGQEESNQTLAQNLWQAPQDPKCLTEKSGFKSMCQALAIMCFVPQNGLKPPLVQASLLSDDIGTLLPSEKAETPGDSSDKAASDKATVNSLLMGCPERPAFKQNAFLEDTDFRNLALVQLCEAISRACRVYIRFFVAEQNRKMVEQERKTGIAAGASKKISDDDAANTLLHKCFAAKYEGETFVKYEVDMKKALHESAKFFLTEMVTNCSPQGLMATLLFHFVKPEATHSGSGDAEDSEASSCPQSDRFRNALLHDGFSTRSFLNLILTGEPQGAATKGVQDSDQKAAQPSGAPPETKQYRVGQYMQVALYLQGLAFRNAHQRAGSEFMRLIVKNLVIESSSAEKSADPQKVLTAIAGAETTKYLKQEEARKVAQVRNGQKNEEKQMKLMRQRQEQWEFLVQHYSPKIFTCEEVEELNKTRPWNDQLELDPRSGMLLHHCACPSCPQYLENMQTPKDLVWNKNGPSAAVQSSKKETRRETDKQVAKNKDNKHAEGLERAKRARRNGLLKHLKLQSHPDFHNGKNFHQTVWRFLPSSAEREKKDPFAKIKAFLALNQNFEAELRVVCAKLESVFKHQASGPDGLESSIFANVMSDYPYPKAEKSTSTGAFLNRAKTVLDNFKSGNATSDDLIIFLLAAVGNATNKIAEDILFSALCLKEVFDRYFKI